MPVKRVYLDSSSIVKRYVQEQGSEIVDELYEIAELGNMQIFFSLWNVGEVLGTLDRYLSRRAVGPDEFEAILSTFIAESIKLGRLGSLSIVPLSAQNLVESWLLVLRQHIYEADALQISTAKFSGCDLLLTADRELADACKREGLVAFDVEEQQEHIRKMLAG